MLSTSLKMIPRTLRAAPAIARAAPTMRMQVARAPSAFPGLARTYASGGGLSTDEIKTRIVDVLKSFEKVDPAQVTDSASFTGDLGLDSLDAVEVVMAIEEEFNIVRPNHRRFWLTAGNPRRRGGQHHHRPAGDRLHPAHSGRYVGLAYSHRCSGIKHSPFAHAYEIASLGARSNLYVRQPRRGVHGRP